MPATTEAGLGPEPGIKNAIQIAQESSGDVVTWATTAIRQGLYWLEAAVRTWSHDSKPGALVYNLGN